jgi:cell division protein ZapA (FtsZ GTPase activity inhibitor)
MDPSGGNGRARQFSPASINAMCETLRSKGHCLKSKFGSWILYATTIINSLLLAYPKSKKKKTEKQKSRKSKKKSKKKSKEDDEHKETETLQKKESKHSSNHEDKETEAQYSRHPHKHHWIDDYSRTVSLEKAIEKGPNKKLEDDIHEMEEEEEETLDNDVQNN